MAKISSRPGREEIKQRRKEIKKAQKELRQNQKKEGLIALSRSTISNSKSEYKDIEEERQGRMDVITNQAMLFRSMLPKVLKGLKRIPDPRNPQKIKHKLTVLIVYGILSFVYQMSSRREANREMTRPQFVENLKRVFPELESVPHHDTLMRLLARIDVNEIERTGIEIIRTLIRKKKFKKYLINGRYSIAIDGTQKLVRDKLLDEQWLERKVGKEQDKQKQYYVYVLEANLVLRNGMRIPLMSEFLSYTGGDNADNKQDCELKAFKRLAPRLKEEFRCLPIMILLDGLYPKGPIIEICRKNNWDFMMVLQDKSLPSVWEEYEGLKQLQAENCKRMIWGDRMQRFRWVNGIYYYRGANAKKRLTLHVVICYEGWKEVDNRTGEIITKTSKHAWISSKPLSKDNIHERCNLGARYRWGIELEILDEKRHGYQYEHCFSYDWNVMKGYHYLMRLGHLFNVIAQYAQCLANTVRKFGVQGFIRFVRETMAAPWLDANQIKERLAAPFQLRLI